MDPCFAWCCYMGYLGCFVGVVEFEDEFFLRGVECDTPIFWKEVKLIFSFLWCSVALGFRVSGGIPQKTVDLLAFFSAGDWELKGESEFGPLILIRWMGAPLLLPNPSRPSPSPQLGCSRPLPLLLSSLLAAAPYPLHGSLLPLDPPHAARIEKRRSMLNWKGREDQGDVLPHLFLQNFLGKP
jgi:hypothetical protein